MIHQKQEANTNYPKVKDDGQRLIDAQLVLLQKLIGIRF